MQDKEKMVEELLLNLGDFSSQDQVEILGNVFLQLGLNTMKLEGSSIDIESVTGIKTLGNSLARQGLTLLIWLKQI